MSHQRRVMMPSGIGTRATMMTPALIRSPRWASVWTSRWRNGVRAMSTAAKRLQLLEQKRLATLKKIIIYKGPDRERQYKALYWLARTLGYWVDDPHESVIRHQNLTTFGHRRSDLTLGARGYGKSTVGDYVRAIKYIIDDVNIRILIGSDTAPASEKFLREIRSHLQSNKDLIAMFGPFLASDQHSDLGRYRDSYLTIKQRTNPTISEPTISRIGTGSQAAGGHFDVIILDDLATEDNSRTPTMRKNLTAWHGSTLIGCTMPHTKIHYLGTRYYPHDIYEDLEKGRPDEERGILADATLTLPAILDYGGPDERSSYPKRYTLDHLKAMEGEMGRYHFASQMQQDTSAGEGLVFSYSDFMWYSSEGDETTGLEPAPSRDNLAIFQFSDLTAKRTDTGDPYATVTVGVTQETEPGQRRVYVLDLVHKRCGMAGQRNSILSQIKLWNPVQHGVEAVQMQAGFAQEIGERYDRRVIEVKVESDKVFRARRVAPVFEGNRVYFPASGTPAGRRMNAMIDELCSFPDSEHDDCVDAIVGAITLALFGSPPAAGGSVLDSDWGGRGDGLRGNY